MNKKHFTIKKRVHNLLRNISLKRGGKTTNSLADLLSNYDKKKDAKFGQINKNRIDHKEKDNIKDTNNFALKNKVEKKIEFNIEDNVDTGQEKDKTDNKKINKGNDQDVNEETEEENDEETEEENNEETEEENDEEKEEENDEEIEEETDEEIEEENDEENEEENDEEKDEDDNEEIDRNNKGEANKVVGKEDDEEDKVRDKISNKENLIFSDNLRSYKNRRSNYLIKKIIINSEILASVCNNKKVNEKDVLEAININYYNFELNQKNSLDTGISKLSSKLEPHIIKLINSNSHLSWSKSSLKIIIQFYIFLNY